MGSVLQPDPNKLKKNIQYFFSHINVPALKLYKVDYLGRVIKFIGI